MADYIIGKVVKVFDKHMFNFMLKFKVSQVRQ